MYYYRRNKYPGNVNDISRIQRELSRMMDDQFRINFSTGCVTPMMNVYTNAEEAVVLAELPGVAADAIEISVVGETLTLSGERAEEKVEDQSTPHRQERFAGKFSRSLALPFPVEVDQVDAHLEKGLLTIKLPRAEEDRPRRVNVNS